MRTGEKVAAAEGSQFGKPATSNGNYSIYQRLATTQGAKYRWSLKHRARPSGSKSGFDTLAVITADTHGAEPPSFSWGGGTDLFHNMFEWMFGNGWDSPGWTFPDSGEGTFKLCSATLGNGTVNGYQSHWYRAGNDCSDTEHFPITWTITFVSSVFNQYTRNGWNEYEGEFAADGDDTVFALASYNTLNGNLAYGNLVDDVSVAAEDGDGGNLVTDGGFESPSLTKDGETGSANAPANAATGWRTTDPNRRITIGHVSKDGQSDYLQMPVHVYVPDNSDGSNGNDQYAELNSNQASSLYQVVNTVPESKYDWGLYHRGRQSKDAMALVVGPKQNVAPMKTSATSGETKSVYSPVALFVRVDGTTTEVYVNGGTQPIGNTGTANQYEIKMKRSDGITWNRRSRMRMLPTTLPPPPPASATRSTSTSSSPSPHTRPTHTPASSSTTP